MKQITIFKCEHCEFFQHIDSSKVLEHEEICIAKPKNTSICFGCTHLEEIPKEYSTKKGVKKSTHCFHCKLFDKVMYPYSCVFKGLVANFPQSFIDETQMPNQCDQYQQY